MIRLRGLTLVALVGGAVFSLPAAGQSSDGSRSVTHVVSVTVPPRVKVKVSALSMMGSQQVSSAVKVTAAPARTNGLALTIHANKAWVLMVRSSTAADTLVAAGSGTAAPVETAVVFNDAPKSGAEAVVLTVATP